MPDGTVTRFDTASGYGLIETSSGKFRVHTDDMEPKARTEGARVHFDVQRDDPMDRAVNVTLNAGTHANPNHRRFGDTG